MIENKNSVTGRGNGLRFNEGKLRYDLVNPKAFEDFVKILTIGANKYSARNWENGLSWTSVIASLERHIAAFKNGEDYDDETGELHIAHAACNVHFLNTFYHTFPQGDDRPKRQYTTPKIGLDIDGVLADFVKAWSNLYDDVSSEPKSWYFDRNIMDRFDSMSKENKLNDFYMSLEPMILSNDIMFEPHCYITSRPVQSDVTEAWLDLHDFPRQPVYTVNVRETKVDVAKRENIEIFIDDSYENFIDLNKNGIFCYLYTASHNIKYDVGHMRLNSLKDLPFL